MNQVHLLEKILLNENQCYMLQNREIHRVIDTKILTDDEENTMKKEKEAQDRKKLIQYLADRKNENNLNPTDMLLFGYLETSIKNEIKEKVEID